MSRKFIYDLLDRNYEKPLLEDLYVEYGVASDQLRREPSVLARIVASFNAATDRDFSASTILRYILNRRKAKDWPCLGATARRFPPTTELLDVDDFSVLKFIYRELDEPSDELLLRTGLAREIARRFHELCGKRVRGSLLVAAIIAKRKRGTWIKIREAFGDIGELGK